MFSTTLYLVFVGLMAFITIGTAWCGDDTNVFEVMGELIFGPRSIVDYVHIITSLFTLASVYRYTSVRLRERLPVISDRINQIRACLSAEAARWATLVRDQVFGAAWRFINAFKLNTVVISVSWAYRNLVRPLLLLAVSPFVLPIQRKYFLWKSWALDQLGDFADYVCVDKEKRVEKRGKLESVKRQYSEQKNRLDKLNDEVTRLSLDANNAWSEAQVWPTEKFKRLRLTEFTGRIEIAAPEDGPVPPISHWYRLRHRIDLSVYWSEQAIVRIEAAMERNQQGIAKLEDQSKLRSREIQRISDQILDCEDDQRTAFILEESRRQWEIARTARIVTRRPEEWIREEEDTAAATTSTILDVVDSPDTAPITRARRHQEHLRREHEDRVRVERRAASDAGRFATTPHEFNRKIASRSDILRREYVERRRDERRAKRRLCDRDRTPETTEVSHATIAEDAAGARALAAEAQRIAAAETRRAAEVALESALAEESRLRAAWEAARAVVATQTAVLESAFAESRLDGLLGVGPNTNIDTNAVTTVSTVADFVDSAVVATASSPSAAIPNTDVIDTPVVDSAIADPATVATVDNHPKPSLEGRGEETVAVAEVAVAPVFVAAVPEEPEPARATAPKKVRFTLPEPEDHKPEDPEPEDSDSEESDIEFEDVWASEEAAELDQVAEEPEAEPVTLAEPVTITNPQLSLAEEPTTPEVEQGEAKVGVDHITEEPETPMERTVKADDEVTEEPMDADPPTQSVTETSFEEDVTMGVEPFLEQTSMAEQEDGVWLPDAHEPETGASNQDLETAQLAMTSLDISPPAEDEEMTELHHPAQPLRPSILGAYGLQTVGYVTSPVNMTTTEASNEEQDCVMGENTGADDPMATDEPLCADAEMSEQSELAAPQSAELAIESGVILDTIHEYLGRVMSLAEEHPQVSPEQQPHLEQVHQQELGQGIPTQAEVEEMTSVAPEQTFGVVAEGGQNAINGDLTASSDATREATLVALDAYYASVDADEERLAQGSNTGYWPEAIDALADRGTYSDISDTSLTDGDMQHLDPGSHPDGDSLFGDFSGDEGEEEAQAQAEEDGEGEADEDTKDKYDGIAYSVLGTDSTATTPAALPTELSDDEESVFSEAASPQLAPRLVPANPAARRILPARGRLSRLPPAQVQAVVAESSQMGAAAAAAASSECELDEDVLAELAAAEAEMDEENARRAASSAATSGEGDVGSDGKVTTDTQAEEDAADPKGKAKAKLGIRADAAARAAVRAQLAAQAAAAEKFNLTYSLAVAQSAAREKAAPTPLSSLESGEEEARFLSREDDTSAPDRPAQPEGDAAQRLKRKAEAAERTRRQAEVQEDKEDYVDWDDSTESEEE
ncbi:predicted protein [Chaetomium globosum CBS 148.51]|uniref:Uncharacterized protein n=1 Tax=Chaetomium globosum (strain ATCC 6205 / CBS 148.51 / DSM 1962 / NBRC 6347 / NRRL 1970) TaxID=306901 RepID=Q2HG06_CHAGB|nr:uncharacterized protein CHGG_00848 [Chaetomium globosum CBS 148.51]EAQ92613.1 predicted protein [Chaetomium globosum CBS 148.51]